ncbi:MAG: hypothetical protein J5594_05970 [Elusimicrobiaceae bacterium]|nr:hypothetical protein [Elusimicrobiaceae bacterium]
MKNKNIILAALIFIMSICFALPSFAQVDMDAIEPNVEEIHTLLKPAKVIKPEVVKQEVVNNPVLDIVAIEEIVEEFEKNLDINLIPDNISTHQLVPFLNVAVNKRNIAVVKEILGKGANLQGSEDIYYQDPLLIALSNKCDNEEMLDTDKEIMKLLVDNGSDMTKPYLTPYQLYDFGVVAEYLHSIKNPTKEAKVKKNDRFNLISVAAGYVSKTTNPYYVEKFDYLLKLGAKNGAVNKIDMKAFATVMSNYEKAGKDIIDILFDNDMIIKEEHALIVKNLTTKRQVESNYPTDGRPFRAPLSSEKIQRMCERTSSNNIRKSWLPELRRVEKEEKLIARLEQKREEQLEKFSKQVEEAVLKINLEKLNRIEQLGKKLNY